MPKPLEFDNDCFDGVTSTFGIRFAARPEDAVRELTRVCKRGGRIGLLTWCPGGAVEGLFGVMRPYMPPLSSPAAPPPFEWGRPEGVRARLGNAFDLKFETGTTTLHLPSGQAGLGLVHCRLWSDQDGSRHSRTWATRGIHERFHGELGIAMPREYLVTVGAKR